MPVFPPSKVSDRELDEIAQYVTSLGNRPAFALVDVPREDSFQLHWMALFSLADDFAEEASQHVGAIIELVTGPHRAQMIQIRTEIQTGNYHTAVHSLEGMLPRIGAGDLSYLGIYLGLARNAGSNGDIQTATHYLEHASDSLCCANEAIVMKITKIQDQLEIGNIANVVRGIEELIDK